MTRARDRKLHRLVCGRLPEAAITVDDDERLGVGDDRYMLIELQLAGGERLDIRTDHADAVRIVASEIGGDEVIGYASCFGFSAARGEPQRTHPFARCIGG